MDTALAVAPAYADWERRTGGFFYAIRDGIWRLDFLAAFSEAKQP
jgi:hypothetical protein